MATTHVSLESPNFWDDFALSHSPLMFHRSLWARVCQEGYGYEPLYCWQEHDGTPCLTMMGVMVKLPFFRIFYSSVPYGGILGSGDVKTFMSDVCLHLKKRGVQQLRVVTTQDCEALLALGFSRQESVRHVVNLQGHNEESLLASLRKSVRRDVRKSQREGIVIREAQSNADIDVVYALYEQTMVRNHAAAKYPIGRFRTVVNVLAPEGLGTIFLATYDGHIIAATTVVCSDDEVHTLQISHNHNYRLLCPNEALIFAALQWTLQSGRFRFDFMGSPMNDKALQRFKEKWNAHPATLMTYSKSLAPLRSQCWELVRWAAASPFGASLVRWWQRSQR